MRLSTQPVETTDRGGLDAALSRFRDAGVEWATCAWVDLSGRPKGKLVPLRRLADIVEGADLYTPRGLAGFGLAAPAEPEGRTVPDVTRAVVLPTDPTVAWVPADMHLGGRPFAHCARSALRRQVDRAARLGLVVNVGMECEVYLLRPDGNGGHVPFATASHLDPTPLYDVEAALETLPVVRPMAAAMASLGWGVEAFDQECGRGQVEFDFGYTDALTMADRFILFRFMLAEYARRAGAVASFMPKPFADSWGSGAHVNLSLADDQGRNLFDDPGDARGLGFSDTAYAAVAGLLRHAGALCALGAPTVNSYKRLVPQGALPDISWAPTVVAYGDNNRSCMLRLPRSRRCVENRSTDIACNPYLVLAMHVAAVLEGLEKALDPGEPCASDTYRLSAGERRRRGYGELPRTLLEAAEALANDPLAAEVLGDELLRDYVMAKTREWEESHIAVSEWERTRYLTAL